MFKFYKEQSHNLQTTNETKFNNFLKGGVWNAMQIV